MTEEEWNNYVDTGFVPHYFIMEIVEGIKGGEILNVEHLQVYQTHVQFIEIYLKKN